MPPKPLIQRVPFAPKELISLCERAMAKERSERLPTASLLAKELRDYREGRTISVHEYRLSERIRRFAKRNRRALTVAMVALLALCALAAYFTVEQRMEELRNQRVLELQEQERQAELERIEQAAQANFNRLVDARRAELNALDARLQNYELEELLNQADQERNVLSFGEGSERWSTQATISRTIALTPQRQESISAVLEDFQEISQLMREKLELSVQPVSGEYVELLSPQERNALVQQRQTILLQAFELALLSKSYRSARLFISNMRSDESTSQALEKDLEQAQNSLADAWVKITRSVMADLQAGRSRPNRYQDFVQSHGFPPRSPEEYVRMVIPFRHERVAELLTNRLAEYTVLARDTNYQGYWNANQRDELIFILGTLGELPFPDITVPVMGEFLQHIRDDASRNDLFRETVAGLCSTEDLRAFDHILEIIKRFGTSPPTNHNFESAKRLLHKIPSGELESAEAYAERAWQYYICGETSRSGMDMQKAIELGYQPQSGEVLLIAKFYADAELYTIALRTIDEYLENLEADSQQGGHGMAVRAEVLRIANRFEEAEEWYRKALEVSPGEVPTWRGLAYCYMNLGRYDDAIKATSEAIRLEPTMADLFVARGRAKLYREQPDLEQALDDFSKAIALNPNEADAWFHRAQTYLSMGHFDLALESAQRGAELAPQDPLQHFYLGLSFYRVGRTNEAITAFEVSLGLDASDQRVWGFLAHCLADRERWEEALDAARTGIKAGQPTLGLVMVEVRALRYTYQFEAARELMDRILADHPNDLGVLMEHHSLLMAERKWDEALDIGQRMIDALPDGHRSKAELEKRAIQLTSSREALNEWITISPETPDEHVKVLAALAIRANWRFTWGELDQAREDLVEAIKRYPDAREWEVAGSLNNAVWVGRTHDLIYSQLVDRRRAADCYAFLNLQGGYSDSAETDVIKCRWLCMLVMPNDEVIKEPLMDYSELGIELPKSDDECLKVAAMLLRQALDGGFDDYGILQSPEFKLLSDSEYATDIFQELGRKGVFEPR